MNIVELHWIQETVYCTTWTSYRENVWNIFQKQSEFTKQKMLLKCLFPHASRMDLLLQNIFYEIGILTFLREIFFQTDACYRSYQHFNNPFGSIIPITCTNTTQTSRNWKYGPWSVTFLWYNVRNKYRISTRSSNPIRIVNQVVEYLELVLQALNLDNTITDDQTLTAVSLLMLEILKLIVCQMKPNNFYLVGSFKCTITNANTTNWPNLL